MQIIGIDYATEARKVGLARAQFEKGTARIEDVKLPNDDEEIVNTVVDWIKDEISTLIAIDAPLGWPEKLGYSLSNHSAGSVLHEDANILFRRYTDRFVKKCTGRQSLDVGANLIARTCHAALIILWKLRERSKKEIPLAWEIEVSDNVSAIEVYPAATLTMHGLRWKRYKEYNQGDARDEIIKGLSGLISLPSDITQLRSNADALDAIVCVLAATDFLQGKAVPPENLGLAKKEGWIWVRQRN
jgi:predicted RNase H-like nuclease